MGVLLTVTFPNHKKHIYIQPSFTCKILPIFSEIILRNSKGDFVIQNPLTFPQILMIPFRIIMDTSNLSCL